MLLSTIHLIYIWVAPFSWLHQYCCLSNIEILGQLFRFFWTVVVITEFVNGSCMCFQWFGGFTWMLTLIISSCDFAFVYLYYHWVTSIIGFGNTCANPLRFSATDYKALRECGLLLHLPTRRGRRKGYSTCKATGSAKLSLVNAHSIASIAELLMDQIDTNNLDLLPVT